MHDIRKDLSLLREGLKRIRQELHDHYRDIDENDGFGRQMWQFAGWANSKLEDLVDDVNHAETTLKEVVRYYGEDENSMSSSEFFAIFQTFATSYRVSAKQTSIFTTLDGFRQKCKADNRTLAEEKLAMERRKQAMAETRAQRQNVEQASVTDTEDNAVLDNLLEKLRIGDSIIRKDRKARKSDVRSPLVNTAAMTEPGDRAKDMLAQLKADGFIVSTSDSSTTATTTSRRRARKRTPGVLSETEEVQSELASPSPSPSIISDMPGEADRTL